MKKFVFLLVFFPMLTFGQSKGDNTLIVYSEQTFENVGKTLIQNGYQILESNSDFQTLMTDWKEARWIKYRIFVAVLDGKIQMQARAMNEGANAVLNSTGSDWLVSYKKSGVEHDIWIIMNALASNFGTQKEYLRK